MSKGDVVYWLWILGGAATAWAFTDNDKKKELGWRATIAVYVFWPFIMAAIAVALTLYGGWRVARRLWRGLRAFWKAVRDPEPA